MYYYVLYFTFYRRKHLKSCFVFLQKNHFFRPFQSNWERSGKMSFFSAIYKYRYTFGDSVVKIGTLYHKNRWIFDIQIGTYMTKIGTTQQVMIKMDTHKIKIGTMLKTAYFYRYNRYNIVSSVVKIGTGVIKIGKLLLQFYIYRYIFQMFSSGSCYLKCSEVIFEWLNLTSSNLDQSAFWSSMPIYNLLNCKKTCGS